MTNQSNAFWTLVFAAVGAVGSAIAAITGLLMWWSSFRKNSKERRDIAVAEQNRWSLSIKRHTPSIWDVQARYKVFGTPDLLVHSLAIVRPRGARFCSFSHDAINEVNSTMGLVIGEARFREVRYGHNTIRGAFEHDRLQNYVEMPPRPMLSISSSPRLRIAVRFEERSASRRQATVIMTSEEIPWTAKQTAKAT